jgi:hypothetical protein
MANKVVLEVEGFEKVVDLFNHTNFPALDLRKAFEVDIILKQAKLMDITPLADPVKQENKPSTDPV